MAQRTPLFDRHVALGATMVEFSGFEMPMQYSNIRDEHTAVRQRAGIFDLSHMGEVRIGGPNAVAAVQGLITNDLDRIGQGRAQYTAMCNESGGMVDDLIVYRGAEDCWIVVNASRRAVDVSWMRAHIEVDDATLADESDDTALLAVQGPEAIGVVAPLVSGLDVQALAPFSWSVASVAGLDGVVVARTGYTGEDGVELYAPSARAGALWDALMEAGRSVDMLPCGLGARDTLRLEAGLRLYGQDMDESVDPLSCGLGWTVRLDKGDFVGADALRRIKESGPPRRFVGLRMAGRGIARHGMSVLRDGEPVGEVTSGTYSFTLGGGIATASLRPDASEPGASFQVDVRGTLADAQQVPLPFYKRTSA
jgi:aminomethyltransferase